MSFIKDLEWRGLIHQTSSPKLVSIVENEKIVLYSGFDPTADSLHIGHLLPLITLKRAQLSGHQPIALIGGATGMIGDPSGKSNERNLLDAQTIQNNVESIVKQIKVIIPDIIIVNNLDWFKDLNIINFMRDVGKHFSINAMLSRDAVKNRLQVGISFTEFSYMLFQAFDFLHLNKNFNCRLQIGGSDQYGNIVSGIDLIHSEGKEAFGLTIPLITNSNGEKFGKSINGALWLDKNKTLPYDVFQFLFNTSDLNVIQLIKFFTFLDIKTIEELEFENSTQPGTRIAQKILASEVCNMIYNEKNIEPPTFNIADNTSIIDVLVLTKLCNSKNDARRNIEQNAVKINGQLINDTKYIVKNISTKILLTKGKRDRCLLKINV